MRAFVKEKRQTACKQGFYQIKQQRPPQKGHHYVDVGDAVPRQQQEHVAHPHGQTKQQTARN